MTPDITNADVAIARTAPASGGAVIRECETLYLDAVAAAKESIYIENQYFTNATIAAALARRLSEPDGPEMDRSSPPSSVMRPAAPSGRTRSPAG